ncbi:MAG: glutamate--tRNA ligase, partial [Aestuariivirgaceae bacterium]
MSSPVITRFAPSPTGFLHIGGARTALFNWLFAKHTQGRMLLRIEDTDRERSTAGAVAAIVDGLGWLGLDWHGDAVSQYSRAERHREVARQLLAAGRAYHCYCTPQELEDMRGRAAAEGRPQRYDGTWRDRNPSTAPAGVNPVIRFKAPTVGETIIDDRVQGRVRFNNKELDDLIILRSDGSPTYNLSVVVDDHDMGVTHIIRGVDHLTNAARQAQIYRSLDWEIPVMAHIPLIHGPDGAKLSKRHGALGVEAYRNMGYLPEAMRNYLARLGWSHGDDEIFTTEQMIEWFSLENIGKSAARFDYAKLEHLNGHYMRSMPDESLLDAFMGFLWHSAEGRALLKKIDDEMKAKLLRALPGLKERAKTLQELKVASAFLFDDPRPDEKAQQILRGEGLQVLKSIYPVLEANSSWTAASLEADVKHFASKHGLKLGQIAQPLRAALTGTSISPGIFDVMAVLEKRATLR